jgi:hypothetical protein
MTAWTGTRISVPYGLFSYQVIEKGKPLANVIAAVPPIRPVVFEILLRFSKGKRLVNLKQYLGQRLPRFGSDPGNLKI